MDRTPEAISEQDADEQERESARRSVRRARRRAPKRPSKPWEVGQATTPAFLGRRVY
jgi:hypothetical protein